MHGTLRLLGAHPVGSYAEPWQLPGSPPSVVQAVEDEAQVEPSTRVSQLREHLHTDTYIVMGRCTLRPSPTHTLAHTSIHTFGRAGVCHTPWPYHTPDVPSDCPSPIQALKSTSCLHSTLSLTLGVGARSTGNSEHVCSQGHGCSSIGRCKQATKVWAHLC